MVTGRGGHMGLISASRRSAAVIIAGLALAAPATASDRVYWANAGDDTATEAQ
jgi:hypothetical protein